MDKLRIDGQKLQFHPQRVAAWLEGKDDWERAKSLYPLYVEISPSGACNHRCTFCSVDYIGYEPNLLNAVMLKDRLAEMGGLGVKAAMWAGEGEPLLHKGINSLVDAAHAAGINTSFTTNGVLLDKLDLDGVSWVKVSLNAGTRETYARVHQTKTEDWDRVWENLADAVKRKGDCTLGVQMVLLPENEHEVAALEAQAAAVGLDYVVIKPYIANGRMLNKQTWQPIAAPKASGKLVVREESIAEREHEYGRCNATPFFWAYIMSNGDLYSCSAHLQDERFNLGNLNDHSFRELWEGEKRRENWKLMQEFDIGACRLNCRMNAANKYLWGFDNQPHLNFV